MCAIDCGPRWACAIQDGGDTSTKARARLICRLMASVEDLDPDRDAGAATPDVPTPGPTNKQLRRRPGSRTAAVAAPWAPVEDLVMSGTDAEHAGILQGIRKRKAVAAGAHAAASLGSHDASVTSGSAKRMRIAASEGTTPARSVAVGAPARRFKVVESWCSCPIGTLPSGVPLVGVMPDFSHRPKAEVAVDAAAAAPSGVPTDGASEGPVAAALAAPRGTEGGCGAASAAAADGGAKGACESQDGCDEVAAAARADVLAVFSALGEAATDVVGDEPPCVGMGRQYGVIDDLVGDGAPGEVGHVGDDREAEPVSRGGTVPDGLVGLQSMVGGVLRDPGCSDGLRERVIRACALALP